MFEMTVKNVDKELETIQEREDNITDEAASLQLTQK